jgi:hypothetical protein
MDSNSSLAELQTMTNQFPGAQAVLDAAYKAWVTQDDAPSIAAELEGKANA